MKLLLALAVLASPAFSQVRTDLVAPLATEPGVTGWLGNHAAVLDTGAAHRQELMVYLHGQGGTGTGAQELLRTAAEEGYHAVGLTYPNDWSPFNLCTGSGDPECALKVRREIITGFNHSPLVTVSRADSVENRLIKLLQHMDALRPGEGWAQFLDNGAVRWEKVAVFGHSQGGGNAGVIAKDHALARCCTSAPAADGGAGSPAAWWAVHATEPGRYFGFCHAQDALSQKVAFWNAVGAPGPVVDVAASAPPFGGSQQLSSSVEPAVAGQYHNSTVIDSVTPREGDGTPRYKGVWRHMLTAEPPVPTSWDDVVYATVPVTGGATVGLRMDIHGATAGAAPHPVVVWVHGGGWYSGDYNEVPSFVMGLRARGITVASIEYRVSQEGVFPAQIHDCKGAVRYLRANAGLYGIDPQRIAAWGSSAGGHLAALLATAGNVPGLEGDTGGNTGYPSAVMAGLAYFPPTDLLNIQPDCAAQSIGCVFNHDAPDSPESRLLGVTGAGEGVGWLRANMNNPAEPFPTLIARADSANPIFHVDASDPPFYIAHGDADDIVPLRQGERLRDALNAAGVENVFRVAAGWGHGFVGVPLNIEAAEWVSARLLSCTADVDHDGDTGTDADIEAFFRCLAGDCCAACTTADFNADGDIGTDADIESFFRVLAGGPC